MSIIGSNILAGASGQGGGYTIEQSLRFNASQSSYLSWTPASAGNRKTWTWSAWVKRANPSANGLLFGARTGVGATYFNLSFQSAGDLRIECNLETAYPLYKTNALFRDPSAWYHVVVALDMTQATSTNRLKVWVNGVLQTTASYNVPAQNTDLAVNSTETHLIGQQASGNYLDGYLTEVNFIDGQALDPSSFGEFDATTGVWKPKEYTGTYGTNGFYLPFNHTAETFQVDYLVVAGGGSGGNGNVNSRIYGGGGAGGYRTSVGTSGGGASAESPLNLTEGNLYTVTVGAGAAGQAVANSFGNKGSNSVFSTITSIGGGAAGDPLLLPDANGGSGGGGGEGGSGVAYGGGAGETGQGFAGGTYVGGTAGGGGGAGAVGADGSSGGNGGDGVASTITGSSVTRAGGGGGGSTSTAGTGGAGGGTNGNTSTSAGANTGSGSGGTATAIGTGNGGSGVVILSIPTAKYSGITTGSPTVTTNGSNTILTYTSSGSYTA